MVVVITTLVVSSFDWESEIAIEVMAIKRKVSVRMEVNFTWSSFYFEMIAW
jgi:hypothetical protein